MRKKEKIYYRISRKEIFNAIMNHHDYMTEFMQAMHGNEHAMMMSGDNQMMMAPPKNIKENVRE